MPARRRISTRRTFVPGQAVISTRELVNRGRVPGGGHFDDALYALRSSGIPPREAKGAARRLVRKAISAARQATRRATTLDARRRASLARRDYKTFLRSLS